MGNYQPWAPFVLGNQWAPIRDDPYRITTDEEIGYTFTLQTAASVVSGGYYVDTPPVMPILNQNVLVSIYSRGQENETGPLKSVMIPCTSAGITGDVLAVDVSNIANNLANPSDLNYLAFLVQPTGGNGNVDMYFDTRAHTELTNKRIVDVSLVYFMTGGFSTLDTSTEFIQIELATNLAGGTPATIDATPATGGDLPDAIASPIGTTPDGELSVASFGEMNPFWGTVTTTTNPNVYPYTFSGLQRFDPATTPFAQRIAVRIASTNLIGDNSYFYLHYAALKVTYCEETRLAYGGARVAYGQGSNRVQVVTANTLSSGITLSAGDYLLTIKQGAQGANDGGERALLNGLQQLYQLPSHHVLRVTRTTTVDTIPVSTDTNQVVPVSLHTATAVVTGTHGYGDPVAAPVYTGTVARQQVYSLGPSAAQTNYPSARFYARRFGDQVGYLGLRHRTQTTVSARIDAITFDALDEIINGWREVNLTFSAPTPSFNNAGLAQEFEWFSDNPAGDRWEVLGARAPALTGNSQQELSSAQNLVETTYFGGTGSAFYSGNQDTRADLTLLLAQTVSPVTGFAIATASQVVTGIALDCLVDPVGIVTGIGYNALSWSPVTGVVLDTFSNRTVVSGWGNTEEPSLPWSFSGGSNSDYQVSGGTGQHVHTVNNVLHRTFVDVRAADVVAYVDFVWPFDTGVGANETIRLNVRFTDIDNWYAAAVSIDTSGIVTLRIFKDLAAALTTISNTATIGGNIAGQRWRVKIACSGPSFWAKMWSLDTSAEPTDWQVAGYDNTPSISGTSVAVMSRSDGGSTHPTPFTVNFDNFTVAPYGFGAYQLDRLDSIDATWQTIMLCSAPWVTGFADYEARVGIQSLYRIRAVHELEFASAWTTGSATLPAPGVAGNRIVTSGNGDTGGILIFTTNARQAGAANLAYVMTWPSNVTEDFAYPESDDVDLQRRYGLDFVTAFRPLERGGDRFTRTLLVQAASVSPAALELGLKSLRDLAWTSVPYICVRTENGDRWLATVVVPSGTIRRNRQLQLAQVQVIETTSTPFAVDPAT